MYTGCIHYGKHGSSYGYDFRNENVRPRNIYGCVFFAAREHRCIPVYIGTHNATDNFHWGTSGWYMYSSLSLTHTHNSHTIDLH